MIDKALALNVLRYVKGFRVRFGVVLLGLEVSHGFGLKDGTPIDVYIHTPFSRLEVRVKGYG